MVSFQPTEEQQLIRDTVAAFSREQIRPVAREADESGQIPSALIQQAWDLGLVQSPIPEALGGAGEVPSVVTGSLVCEELGWGDLSIALHMLAPRLVIQPLLTLGNSSQQQQVFPAYTGSHFTAGTAAIVEPRFGFDANELATTAAPQGSDFIVNGTKCFVPLAVDAQHISRPYDLRTRKKHGTQGGRHLRTDARQLPYPSDGSTHRQSFSPPESFACCTGVTRSGGCTGSIRVCARLRQRAASFWLCHRAKAGHCLHPGRNGAGD
jgi:alkylation response protein AidB-like acyl-CoA dehydrogenase